MAFFNSHVFDMELIVSCFLFKGTASGTLGSTVTSYRDYISKAALDIDNVITFDTVLPRADDTLSFLFDYFCCIIVYVFLNKKVVYEKAVLSCSKS